MVDGKQPVKLQKLKIEVEDTHLRAAGAVYRMGKSMDVSPDPRAVPPAGSH